MIGYFSSSLNQNFTKNRLFKTTMKLTDIIYQNWRQEDVFAHFLLVSVLISDYGNNLAVVIVRRRAIKDFSS